jgi:hypothetical protein
MVVEDTPTIVMIIRKSPPLIAASTTRGTYLGNSIISFFSMLLICQVPMPVMPQQLCISKCWYLHLYLHYHHFKKLTNVNKTKNNIKIDSGGCMIEAKDQSLRCWGSQTIPFAAPLGRYRYVGCTIYDPIFVAIRLDDNEMVVFAKPNQDVPVGFQNHTNEGPWRSVALDGLLCGVRFNGTVQCWPPSDPFLFDIDQPVDINVTSVSVSRFMVYALLTNGSVVAWGNSGTAYHDPPLPPLSTQWSSFTGCLPSNK